MTNILIFALRKEIFCTSVLFVIRTGNLIFYVSPLIISLIFGRVFIGLGKLLAVLLVSPRAADGPKHVEVFQ